MFFFLYVDSEIMDKHGYKNSLLVKKSIQDCLYSANDNNTSKTRKENVGKNEENQKKTKE
jgi:hypothetical protein